MEQFVGQAVNRLPVRDERLPAGLTEKVSSFGRAELLQALAQAQPDGARVRELEPLADRLLGRYEVVRLADGPAQARVSEPRYSTRELLTIEAALISDSIRRRIGAKRVPRRTAEQFVRRHPLLTPEQQDVVRELCASSDGVAMVRAAAGTGKTFVLDTAREVWKAAGIEVHGCALSARAALELEGQAGILSRTIAGLLHELDSGGRLPPFSVLVVDEAGMVGTRDLARLAEAAQEGHAKLVLVGDDRQLPEIDAGGAFRSLAERLGALELRHVVRQRDIWDREALSALRNGETERWARTYLARGRVKVSDTADDARAALVGDWSRAPGDAVMIAARRADVKDLNVRARELLQARAQLPENELRISGRDYATGDRVVATRNDRARGVLNGQRGTITAIAPTTQTIAVALDNGDNLALDRAYLAAGWVEHAYALTAHRAQGATVDQAFVLADDRMTREWAYTALSRHRVQAGLYVTRADIESDLPGPAATVRGLARLVNQSGAKALALDSLDLDFSRRPERPMRRTAGRDAGIGIDL